jgi:hypothetical protein
MNRLLSSRSIGAHEGVYHTNPTQMAVRWPANVDDDDLTNEVSPLERPSTQYTKMSYIRYRIQLAEIARCVADKILLVSTNLGPSKYSDVLAVDADIEKLLASLPPFFRLRGGPAGRLESTVDYPPFIKCQKYFINLSIFALRCKLNLPFLSLGFANKAFSHSREACLDAARKAIQAEMELEEDDLLPFVELRLRMTGLLPGLFLATSALFMDICLRNAPASEEIRKGETGHALRILESAARHSRLASCLLRSMLQVLRKHSIESNQNNVAPGDQRAVAVGTASGPPISDIYRHRQPELARLPQAMHCSTFASSNSGIGFVDMGANMEQQSNGQIGDGMDLTAFFGELAESFGSDPTENIDWNKMLSELDSTFA